ncbi:mannosyltransferase [Fusarium odoratissimum]
MSAAFIVSVIAGALSCVFLVWLIRGLAILIPTRYQPSQKAEDDHIQILVVGDVGRSPRMQYHALSVAKHGRNVDIVGYKETSRHPDLIGNPRVTMYALPPQPEVLQWGTLPFFLNIPLKVLWQFWGLFSTLMYDAPAAKWIIIQLPPKNPPSIPTFHVALLVSFLRGSKLVVDWHNYGYTILAQGKWYVKPLVPVYRWYETGFGRYLGDINLSVTDAMARQLKEKPFNLKRSVLTLHDRPAQVFQPILSTAKRLAFLSRLAETKDIAKDIVDGAVRLIVSSTSWTPDEDFGLLLDALVSYASSAEASPILAIITGKGPQKELYLEKIKTLQEGGKLPGVRIITAWLSTRDYASLLASADLGISLHKSSSGVDLPMKVVDMFGAGLPVAAYSAFESFSELVKEGQNGCGFETSSELSEILARLLSFSGQEELARLKKGAVSEGSLRWDQEWDRVVGKVIGLVGEESI